MVLYIADKSGLKIVRNGKTAVRSEKEIEFASNVKVIQSQLNSSQSSLANKEEEIELEIELKSSFQKNCMQDLLFLYFMRFVATGQFFRNDAEE